jgi:hypothetical protein
MNASFGDLSINDNQNDLNDISSSDIDIDDAIQNVIANLNANEGKE